MSKWAAGLLSASPTFERRANLSRQEQFNEKLWTEYDAFIERLKAKTPDEILEAAYEKVWKNEIVIMFESSLYSESEYAALLKIENPLDALYADWIDADSADLDALRDCVNSTVERETGAKLNVSHEKRAAVEIVVKPEKAAHVLNGEVRLSDWVIVKPGEEYDCCVGQVIAIDKVNTIDHGTENETDDIHVNFAALEYNEIAKADMLEAFGALYPYAASFDDLPLDDVIMAPDNLISLTGLDFERIDNLSTDYKAAKEFCIKLLSEQFNRLKTQLINRIEQNYADFNQSLLSLSNLEIIEKAAIIHAYSDAKSYLTEHHQYSDEELRFLTQLVNPLRVVAHAWHDKNTGLEGMCGTIDFVYERRDLYLSEYPLLSSKPEPEKPQEQPESASAKENSAFDMALSRGKAKSEAYKTQRAQEPKNTKTKTKGVHEK